MIILKILGIMFKILLFVVGIFLFLFSIALNNGITTSGRR